jgi:hypothetical protein
MKEYCQWTLDRLRLRKHSHVRNTKVYFGVAPPSLLVPLDADQ